MEVIEALRELEQQKKMRTQEEVLRRSVAIMSMALRQIANTGKGRMAMKRIALDALERCE